MAAGRRRRPASRASSGCSEDSDEVRTGARFGPEGDHHEFGEELGNGTSGRVFACRRLADGEELAVKVIDLDRLQLTGDVDLHVQRLDREVAILRKLQHERIVNLCMLHRTERYYFIVMERVWGGELFYEIVQRKSFTEPEARHVFLQLLEGVSYMHSKCVIHRDLKPENILITNTHEAPDGVLHDVKIADFGLSKLICEGASLAKTVVGTPQYWAPEVLNADRNGGTYDHTADFWGLGAVLFVMLCGRYPFDGKKMPMEEQISTGAVNMKTARWKEISSSAQDIVRGLLRVDPSKRLGLEECLRHPWVASAGISLTLTPCAPVPPERRVTSRFSGAHRGPALPATEEVPPADETDMSDQASREASTSRQDDGASFRVGSASPQQRADSSVRSVSGGSGAEVRCVVPEFSGRLLFWQRLAMSLFIIVCALLLKQFFSWRAAGPRDDGLPAANGWQHLSGHGALEGEDLSKPWQLPPGAAVPSVADAGSDCSGTEPSASAPNAVPGAAVGGLGEPLQFAAPWKHAGIHGSPDPEGNMSDAVPAKPLEQAQLHSTALWHRPTTTAKPPSASDNSRWAAVRAALQAADEKAGMPLPPPWPKRASASTVSPTSMQFGSPEGPQGGLVWQPQSSASLASLAEEGSLALSGPARWQWSSAAPDPQAGIGMEAPEPNASGQASDGEAYADEEVVVHLNELLKLQASIVGSLQLAFYAMRKNNPVLADATRQTFREARDLFQHAADVVSKYSQMANEVVRVVLPDLELAVQERKPSLALSLLGMVQGWITEMKEAGLEIQRRYSHLQESVAMLEQRARLTGVVDQGLADLVHAAGFQATAPLDFWENMDGTVQRLTQMKEHAERLVTFTSSSERIKERFELRLGDYANFWKSLMRLCEQYAQDHHAASRRMAEFVRDVNARADLMDAVELAHRSHPRGGVGVSPVSAQEAERAIVPAG